MKSKARRSPSAWVAAFALCAFVAACDFSIDDIKLDEPSAEKQAIQVEHWQPGVHRTRVTRASGAALERARIHRASRRGGRVDDGDGGTDDVDTGVDEDGSVVDSDPCTNGTFQCGLVYFVVAADFNVPLSIATLTITIDGYSFSTRTDAAGNAELRVPTSEWVWLSTAADDAWTSEGPALFLPNDTQSRFFITIFDSKYLEIFLTQIHSIDDPKRNADPSKGFALINYAANVEGAGVDVGRPTDLPFVFNDNLAAVPGPTLVAGSQTLMGIPAIELGRLTVMPYGPAGKSCWITQGGDFAYESKPNTILFLGVACGPTAP